MGLVRVIRGLALAGFVLGGVFVGLCAACVSTAGYAVAQTASSIVVEGNRRVESDTIRSYFRLRPGERLDAAKVDEGIKALIATGLFSDARPTWSGGRVIITVVENQVISRVAFEGNKRVKDEQLLGEIQSKPRGAFSLPTVQSDVQRIVEIYRRNGRYDIRVTPRVIDRPNNRVDLVFEIAEGGKTTIKDIDFVGNRAYSTWRLRDVIKTGQSNLLSFLKNNDLYDPDRVEADRDLLRRFYLKNGYADVRIVSAVAEFVPARNGFILTFTIEEGERYSFGAIDIQSGVRDVDIGLLRSRLRVSPGGTYNAELVEKSVEEMTIEMSRRGYAFATVRPRGDRNFETRQVSIVFVVEEGARAYIERINLRGNTRTRDHVIRREFDISEGDAYNRVLVDRAERRLKNLGYFKTVKITTEPGSSGDRIILNVELEEQSTGEFSVAGGYSTSDGLVAEVSVGERNLLGTGTSARAAVQFGQRTRGIELGYGEPYFLDYRLAFGIDVFAKQVDASSSFVYRQETIGGGFRFGIPLREDLGLQLRYQAYRQKIDLDQMLMNCNNVNPNFGLDPFSAATYPTTLGAPTGFNPATLPPGGYTGLVSCYADGEASAAVKQQVEAGARDRVAGRIRPRLQHGGQQQEPDARHPGRAAAGFRGPRRRRQLHPHQRRRAHVLRADVRRRLGAARAGRTHHRLGRQRPAHARPLPDGAESGARLPGRRHRAARPDARHHAGRARRHDVLGHVVRGADPDLRPAEGFRHALRDVCRRGLGLGLQRPGHLRQWPERDDGRSVHRRGHQQDDRALLDRCGRHLGLAVRPDPCRLRVPAQQGSERPDPGVAVLRRHEILGWA